MTSWGWCLDADESHIFPQLSSVCSQLAAGSGNFLCSCAFFQKFHIPFYLYIYIYPTNTKASDIRSGHILQDRICCLFHISGRSLFYLTFIPLWTQDGPTYIHTTPPPKHTAENAIMMHSCLCKCINNFCCLALDFHFHALQHLVVSQSRPYRGKLCIVLG